ncbi:TetR/AcrR family transcriptional regulator [Glaciibacter sp. 2TAF33]|uniref:TetR/AcrR family transcriptional regulator n=1 Tax=Glaciibacter sp. 2TAF33 TaxID=3233015 RepID=UPI003F93A90F
MMSKATDRSQGPASRPLIKQLRDGDDGAQWRGRERAEQILDVATTLFHTNGFNATSMDEISQSVGILKGSLYHYIDSKDDLLYVVCSQVGRAADKMSDDAVARLDLSPLDRLLHYLGSQVRYNALHAVKIAVYHHEWRRLSGEYLDEMKRLRHANTVKVRGLLVEATELGELAPALNVDLTVRHVLGIATYTYTWYQPGGPITTDELVDYAVRLVRRALSAEPEGDMVVPGSDSEPLAVE